MNVFVVNDFKVDTIDFGDVFAGKSIHCSDYASFEYHGYAAVGLKPPMYESLPPAEVCSHLVFA